MSKKLILPTLRGRIGDWHYYSSIMSFKEIASRVSMADEIHKNKGLRTLIQREVKDRTKGIVEYLKSQNQRFFNAIIIGIYDGNPSYQEIAIEKFKSIGEGERDYLNRTFGILHLDGNEKLFAIDGQHRSKAIKDVLKEKKDLEDEEISVVFVPHQSTTEGLIRTRRLFSTLNRYAKPVSKSEIIAIDEEDNCAIITRNLVEDFKLFKDIILFNQTRSISISNDHSFTNIIVLYDFVVAILTNQKVFGVKVSGEDHKLFTHRRASETDLSDKQKEIEKVFDTLFKEIPSLKYFLKRKKIDRKAVTSSLLFRPIGQNILYSVLKIGMEHNKLKKVIEYFARDTFNLKNTLWKKFFIDEETGRMKTDKTIQRAAFFTILLELGIKLQLTKKDKEVLSNFGIEH